MKVHYLLRDVECSECINVFAFNCYYPRSLEDKDKILHQETSDIHGDFTL